MIIQCAQCSSKFRLDDSKITEAGIKVRCSKCKHIFVVKKEASAEEPDLDLILQGLQSPGREAAAPEPETTAAATAVSAPAVPPEEFKGDEFSVPGVSAGEVVPEAPPEASREGEEGDMFSFGMAPPAPPEEEVSPAGDLASTEFDFGTVAPEEPAEDEIGAFSATSAGTVAMEPEKELAEEGFAVSFDEEIVFDEVSPEAFAAATQVAEAEGGDKSGEAPEITFEFEEEPAPAEVGLSPGTEKGVEHFDFDEIDFGIEDSGVVETRREEPGLISSGADDREFRAPAGPEAAGVEPEPVPVPPVAVPFGEDELPPLTIASRRKGRSFLPAAVITVSVLMIIALAGGGFYFFKEGPEALDKLGIGFVAGWLGMESREEGRIGLDKVSVAFLTNGEAGEVFVIRGEAVNGFRKPRASIQVKGAILGSNGQVLAQKVAYCGNNLSAEQIGTMPMTRIDAAMNNQFGDSLANLGVPPGKSIPFVIVLAKVPKEAIDYSVEVVGSTVANQ